MADMHLAGGWEMVVFEFLFPSSAQAGWFHDALRADVAVHMLTLWAPLATVTEREAARNGRERLGPVVAECWHMMADRLPELGALIDATQPVKDVVRQAEHALQTDRGLLRSGSQAAHRTVGTTRARSRAACDSEPRGRHAARAAGPSGRFQQLSGS